MQSPTQTAMEAALQTLLNCMPLETDKLRSTQGAMNSEARPTAASVTIPLDDQIGRLETAVQAFQDYGARKVANLKRERNEAVPKLHGLPDEVLADVLLWTRDEGNHQQDPTLLHTFAQVCRRWHTLVLSSPKLWSRISSLYDPTTQRLFLRKSGAVPLTIVLSPRDRPEFFDTISSSSPRCRTVIWRGYISTRTTDFLRHLPLAVEEIDLSQAPAVFSHHVSTFKLQLVGTTPFKHVTLSRVRVNWNSPRLSQLSSLDLSDLPLDWENVQPIISASPSLQTLCLRNISYLADYAESRNHGIVSLPNLSKLVIKQVGLGFTSSLVRTLSTPNVQFLFIDRVPGDLLSEIDVPLLHAVIGLMETAPEITLSARTKVADADEVFLGTVSLEDIETWSRRQRASGFHIGFQCGHRDSILELLERGSVFVSFSGSHSPIALDVGSQRLSPSMREMLPPSTLLPRSFPSGILVNLPRVSRIKFREDFHVQSVIDILASPESGGQELCPQLESLDIGNQKPWNMTRFRKHRKGEFEGGIWRRDR